MSNQSNNLVMSGVMQEISDLIIEIKNIGKDIKKAHTIKYMYILESFIDKTVSVEFECRKIIAPVTENFQDNTVAISSLQKNLDTLLSKLDKATSVADITVSMEERNALIHLIYGEKEDGKGGLKQTVADLRKTIDQIKDYKTAGQKVPSDIEKWDNNCQKMEKFLDKVDAEIAGDAEAQRNRIQSWLKQEKEGKGKPNFIRTMKEGGSIPYGTAQLNSISSTQGQECMDLVQQTAHLTSLLMTGGQNATAQASAAKMVDNQKTR